MKGGASGAGGLVAGLTRDHALSRNLLLIASLSRLIAG
jgi:hypothetical protein